MNLSPKLQPRASTRKTTLPLRLIRALMWCHSILPLGLEESLQIHISIRKQIQAQSLHFQSTAASACSLPTWSPVPIYLQIIWNEDFAGFLNHWLRFELFFRELAFTRVKHLLARDAGKGKICGVRFVAYRNLDSLGVNGAWCVTICWQDLTCKNKRKC